METIEEVNKREYMSAEEDARKMENSHLDEARADGKAEGITQGKSERNIEIAKNMLNDGVPIESISKYTGLTEKGINTLK